MPEPHGRLVLYGSTAKTILRAPALSGSPEFTNNGSYWGISGEIEAGKLNIYALYQGGKAYVFVVQSGKAVRQWVDAGEDDGERVEIRSGLAANESVVVLGNYELQDGMAVKAQ